MFKNLNRRAQARDFDPSAREPSCRTLFEASVEQNLEAETLLRQREKMAAYEQDRTDLKMGIEFGIIPFPGRAAQMPETIRPAQPVLTPIDLITDEAPLAPLQSKTSAASRTDTPLSVALEEYLKKRHKERGHDAERGELGLFVQFMMDQLDDPATGAITPEQLERIERMLPDIPDRLGLPRVSSEPDGPLRLRPEARMERPQTPDRSPHQKDAITPGSANSSVGGQGRT